MAVASNLPLGPEEAEASGLESAGLVVVGVTEVEAPVIDEDADRVAEDSTACDGTYVI